MSRIELSESDAAVVENVRSRLHVLDERGARDLDRDGLIDMTGRLMALVDALLAVIDGPDTDSA